MSCSNDDDSSQQPNAIVNLKINDVIIPLENIEVVQMGTYVSINAWNGDTGFEEEDLWITFHKDDFSNNAVGYIYSDTEAMYTDFEYTKLTTSTSNQSTGEFSGNVEGLIDYDLDSYEIITTENYFEISFEVNY
ncbi:hypothetical protein [Psychroflexus salis]|uniref:hypothetical protein n=1 Tax=Psychroflexus salis TaxID=1526574 RepID=UPI00166C4984|nr:hypothetical protein [Psychroflexus salis]